MYELRVLPLTEALRARYQAIQTTGENSGLDLYCPQKQLIGSTTSCIDYEIQCEMIDLSTGQNVAYLLIPRSSIYKTPLRMSNSLGLIDAGYRGNIKAVVDLRSTEDYTVEEGSRLFQLVAPNFQPFLVRVVEELSGSQRGFGGFGSTGV